MFPQPDNGVLVLYNLPGESAPLSDRGVLAEVASVSAALDALHVSHRLAGVRGLEDAAREISAGPETVVVNLVENFEGDSEGAANIPAACECLGRTVTGSDTACLALTLDKIRTKAILQSFGVPVPRGVWVAPGTLPPAHELPEGPYIVKPARADASEGIYADTSVVSKSGQKLWDAIERVHKDFSGPALVEQFVGRRELNVSIIERHGRLEVLPIAEIDFSAFGIERPRIVDYAAKWVPNSFAYRNTPRVLPADLPRKTVRAVRDLAEAAWRAVKCRDYARVDLRMDEECRLFVLEVNANPDISPDAGFAAALEAAGHRFSDFMQTLIENARTRRDKQVKKANRMSAKPGPGPRPEVKVRPIRRTDAVTVKEIVRGTPLFRPDEVDVADEVLTDSIEKGPRSGYRSLVAELKGRVVGWVSFGPVPCTLSTFDVYWIVVDTGLHRGGIGTSLMNAAEDEIRRAGGRLISIDTSGRTAYDPTRRFYLRNGYQEATRLPAFYAPGDDKVILLKNLFGHEV